MSLPQLHAYGISGATLLRKITVSLIDIVTFGIAGAFDQKSVAEVKKKLSNG